MPNFLGMGAPELIFILIIALIIIGPNKLPEIAGSIGKGVRDFRRFQQEMTREVTQELNLEEEKRELAAMKAELAGITNSFKQPIEELSAEMRAEKQEWAQQARDLSSTFDISKDLQTPAPQAATPAPPEVQTEARSEDAGEGNVPEEAAEVEESAESPVMEETVETGTEEGTAPSPVVEEEEAAETPTEVEGSQEAVAEQPQAVEAEREPESRAEDEVAGSPVEPEPDKQVVH